MKLHSVPVLAKLSIPVLLTAFATLLGAVDPVAAQHGFRVKEYEAFHDVLHPLEHEALPKKDFKRIRAKSALLVNRGRAIVRVGVPEGVSEEKKEEFTNELKKFDQALTKFRTAARNGTNAQLQFSYNAVHDSFEMLAAMLR